jgi:hypothetical protein
MFNKEEKHTKLDQLCQRCINIIFSTVEGLIESLKQKLAKEANSQYLKRI